MPQESLLPDEVRTTGRGNIDRLERYYTPDQLAHFCLNLLPWQDVGSVLEPHGGGGSFVRQFERLGLAADLHVLDIDPTCWVHQKWPGETVEADFLSFPDLPRVDRVIGNPPFSNAEEHVDRGLGIASEVCFLLPMSRIDAQARTPWYINAPLRKVWALGERVWSGSRQIGFFWFDASWTHSWWQTEVVLWQRPGGVDAPAP